MENLTHKRIEELKFELVKEKVVCKPGNLDLEIRMFSDMWYRIRAYTHYNKDQWKTNSHFVRAAVNCFFRELDREGVPWWKTRQKNE